MAAIEIEEEVRATSVVIADDHPAVREAARTVLEDYDYRVLGMVGDGKRALAIAARLRPDVILLDLHMPKMKGGDLIRAIKKAVPSTQILVYTGYATAPQVGDCFDAGASGVVDKEAAMDELIRAVEQVACGEQYLDAKFSGFFTSLASEQQGPTLSIREREVLRMLSDGHEYSDIASQLYLSVETVRTHMKNAQKKLAVSNRTQAVSEALRRGMIV